MAGLTAAGFLALRLDEVRAEIEAAWRSRFGANADLAADSPDAQIVGILAEREASLWEQLALIYAAGHIDSATGAALDELAALAGLSRLQASPSTVTLEATGTPGTLLPAGRQVRIDDTETVWELAEATIGGGGTVDVVATATEDGPTQALTGSDWTIVTPVTGWTAITNAADAELGRVLESDESLRQRIRRGFVSLGSTADGIRSAVSRVEGVEEVVVHQNVGMVTDADGRPAKSFEVVVRGGDDNEIAEAILATKPDGIQAWGAGMDSGTATNALGGLESIPFTRPTEVDVHIELDLEIDVGAFPADGLALVAAEVLAFEEGLTIGEDVVPFQILQGVETPGIVTATMRLGRTASPADSAPLSIGAREIAALDSSRITVTVV